MRTISNPSLYRNEGYRTIVKMESGSLVISENEIIQNTFTIDCSMTEAEGFQIGTAISDEVHVTLANTDGRYSSKLIGVEFDLKLAALPIDGSVSRDNVTWDTIGTYIVMDADTSFTDKIALTLNDRMVLFDKKVPYGTFGIAATLFQHLQNACQACGVGLSVTADEQAFLEAITVASRSYTIYDDMSYRDMIRFMAELMWESAYINASGNLAFRHIGASSVTSTPQNRFDSKISESVTIGPLRVTDLAGNVTYTYGEGDGQEIDITETNNRLVRMIGTTLLAEYYGTLTVPGASVIGTEYYPMTITSMPFYEAEPGDMMVYTKADGTTVNGIITSIGYVVNGACGITSSGKSEQRSMQYIGKLTNAERIASVLDTMLENGDLSSMVLYITTSDPLSVAKEETSQATLTACVSKGEEGDTDPDGTKYQYVWYCTADDGSEYVFGVGKHLTFGIDSILCKDRASIRFTVFPIEESVHISLITDTNEVILAADGDEIIISGSDIPASFFSIPVNVVRYDNGTFIKLTTSAAGFVSYDYDPANPDAATYTPTQITISAQFEGDVTFGKWQYSYDGTIWGDVTSEVDVISYDGNSLVIGPTSDMFLEGNTRIIFKCVSDDRKYYDTISISKDIEATVLYRKVWTDIQKTEEQISLIASEEQLEELAGGLTLYERTANLQVQAAEISSTVSKKVNEDEIISKINQTPEQVTIDASKVNLSGYVTISNLAGDGTTVINGSNITTGEISADRISGGTLKLGGANNVDGLMEVYDAENHLIGKWDVNGAMFYKLDGSYVKVDADIGFSGYDKDGNPLFWVSESEFHMRKSVVEEEITLCNRARFIAVDIYDSNDLLTNSGIALVRL